MAGLSLHFVGRAHPTFPIRSHTPTPTSAGYQELGLSQVVARISKQGPSDIGAVESGVIQ